jgi:hypothetical protein
MKLVVKGRVFEAMTAALANLPEGTLVEDLYGDGTTTVLEARGDDLHCDVAAWFNESNPCVEGQGYPVGTLLHFSDPSVE